jgi:hypothetical protein
MAALDVASCRTCHSPPCWPRRGVREPVLEEFCDGLVAGVDVAVALLHSESPVGVVVGRRCADLVEARGVVLAQDEFSCDEVLFELFAVGTRSPGISSGGHLWDTCAAATAERSRIAGGVPARGLPYATIWELNECSMSRSADRLRSSGEGPRAARPTTPGDHDAEVSAAQAPCAGACTSSTRPARRRHGMRRGRPPRHERRRARPPGPPGRPRSGRPSCRKGVSLSVLRPDSGTPGPTTRVAHRLQKERKVMDPQGITEEPQDRTGSCVRREDEYTPQELAGGRS